MGHGHRQEIYLCSNWKGLRGHWALALLHNLQLQTDMIELQCLLEQIKIRVKSSKKKISFYWQPCMIKQRKEDLWWSTYPIYKFKEMFQTSWPCHGICELEIPFQWQCPQSSQTNPLVSKLRWIWSSFRRHPKFAKVIKRKIVIVIWTFLAISMNYSRIRCKTERLQKKHQRAFKEFVMLKNWTDLGSLFLSLSEGTGAQECKELGSLTLPRSRQI